ncbi:MAG: hypothetical protein S4CHLAM2_06910 [Chlamydiales bacterium]|nr:hypothetical protein [Chlamydiales bacterium]
MATALIAIAPRAHAVNQHQRLVRQLEGPAIRVLLFAEPNAVYRFAQLELSLQPLLERQLLSLFQEAVAVQLMHIINTHIISLPK